ncbi:MAG: hypothetical protein M2R45_00452 [Verrucomicrobia subdivision 3 bacterium]|nr:hypothetical protein [Limisphaerales bacterium]MCS1413668.1 hypothetical protein [Limisphaerales bacterium]
MTESTTFLIEPPGCIAIAGVGTAIGLTLLKMVKPIAPI